MDVNTGSNQSMEVEDDNQLVEIRNRNISKDENLLPVHFLPEGKQCYDWIDNDMRLSKEKMDVLNSHGRPFQSPEHKQKTEAFNSITYSSCHMGTDQSVNSTTDKGSLQKLLKAAEDGNLDELKEILDKFPRLINSADGDGYTALHRASYSGHENTLLYLLTHGANVNAKTHDGWQAIHCAARWNNLEVCKVLLEHKADINASTNGKQTPLHFAALSESNAKVLEMFLLNANIDVNVPNAAGDTPYDLAKRNGPQYKLFDLVNDRLKI